MFLSVYKSDLQESTRSHERGVTNEHSIFMQPTDEVEIGRIIASLKPKTSCGHDGLNCKLIKQLIAIPIYIIINKSLSSGTIPTSMKTAKVIPLFKSKDKTSLGNYRPISLLPAFSKILEKCVYHRLYSFCTSYDILNPNQYGFRSGHSTIHAVTKLTADILASFDNNKDSLAVFLDLSKAFDTIDHDILIKKMNVYGIRGIALDWFKNYLTGRKQFVSYGSVSSEHCDINCGVPQGSVLGPLLFIIYTNDLPHALEKAKCILFADDTTVYLDSNNHLELRNDIESDLTRLDDWFRANKLSLNVLKTNFIMFHRKYRDQNMVYDTLSLGNQDISRVSATKFWEYI